jgi:hypothetical protein
MLVLPGHPRMPGGDLLTPERQALALGLRCDGQINDIHDRWDAGMLLREASESLPSLFEEENGQAEHHHEPRQIDPPPCRHPGKSHGWNTWKS